MADNGQNVVRVCAKSDVSPGSVKAFAVGTSTLAVYNIDGTFYITDDECTHAAASLADGMLEGDVIECCMHMGSFHVPTGNVVAPPCEMPLRTYKVVLEGDDILVDLAHNAAGEPQMTNGPPMQDKVVIVGGGIGGLAAALALVRRGIDVDVYEQARELRELGAGVQISPNGTRVLHALGLKEALEQRSGAARPARRSGCGIPGQSWNGVRARHGIGRALRLSLHHHSSRRSARRDRQGACLRRNPARFT